MTILNTTALPNLSFSKEGTGQASQILSSLLPIRISDKPNNGISKNLNTTAIEASKNLGGFIQSSQDAYKQQIEKEAQQYLIDLDKRDTEAASALAREQKIREFINNLNQ